MLNRIDLFLPPKSRYGALPYFTRCMAESLSRIGVRCRIFEAKKDDPKVFLDKFYQDKPDATLSFNGLLPDTDGRFFCEMTQTPHVACLVDAPQGFTALTLSPLTIVTCVDKHHQEFFKGLNVNHALFMPHGVDRSIFVETDCEQEKIYEVLFPISFIDYESILENWKRLYPKSVVQALLEATELILKNREISTYHALTEVFDQLAKKEKTIEFKTMDFLLLLDQLENYVISKSRIDLLRSIRDATVHVVGYDAHLWGKYLPNKSNIIFHPPISFERVLHMMRQSKFVINNCPVIKHGTHERILSGIASGALMFSEENPFMKEHFTHKRSILFYDFNQLDAINTFIEELLKNDDLRTQIIKDGQQIVREGHTWDHRAKKLINDLESIIV